MQATSTSIVPFDPMFADPERLALAGFLAGYSGQTRDAYALDLRQFLAYCHEHGLELLKAGRADIEIYARTLEARSRARGHHRPPPFGGGRRLPLRRRRRPHRPLASGPRPPSKGWTTSPTPSHWTATNWAWLAVTGSS